MIFKGQAGFQRVIYIAMNVVIGVVLSACITIFVMGAPITVEGLAPSVVTSFFIGYTVSDLVPALDWGYALAEKLGAKGRVAVHLISSAVLAFFMGTLILLFMAFLNVFAQGGMAGVVSFFASAYGLVLVAAYACILAFLPLVMKLAGAVTGFRPGAPAVEEG